MFQLKQRIDMTEKHKKWSLTIINDPGFLSSETVVAILKSLSDNLDLKFLIMDFISGSGDNYIIPELQGISKKKLVLDEAIPMLLSVNHFEWGDFFLFKNNPMIWEESENSKYPDLIAQTDITVRAVDGQYIYIYSPNDGFIEDLKDKYHIELFEKGFLDDFEYPE